MSEVRECVRWIHLSLLKWFSQHKIYSKTELYLARKHKVRDWNRECTDTLPCILIFKSANRNWTPGTKELKALFGHEETQLREIIGITSMQHKIISNGTSCVPKCMSCHKAIVMIARRAHYFHNIMLYIWNIWRNICDFK